MVEQKQLLTDGGIRSAKLNPAKPAKIGEVDIKFNSLSKALKRNLQRRKNVKRLPAEN